MSLLLRVELPDVPGRWVAWRPPSVRPAATSRRSRSSRSGTTARPSTTCSSRLRRGDARLDRVGVQRPRRVQVVWISRYAAGSNLFLDLEVVEELTAARRPRFRAAGRHAADHLPLRMGAWVGPGDEVLRGTEGAPTQIPYIAVDKPVRLDSDDGEDLLCAAPLAGKEVVVLGRRGGRSSSSPSSPGSATSPVWPPIDL